MVDEQMVAGGAAGQVRGAGVARLDPVVRREVAAQVYARMALGAAFLSAVASRFGLWDGTLDLAHFSRFIQFTAEVNAFMPAASIPFLAVAATVAESSFGIALIVGFQVRWAALGSALLLAAFATAMAISLGPQSPMDYSVFSASACALLLAISSARETPVDTRAHG